MNDQMDELEAVRLAQELVRTCEQGPYHSIMIPAETLRALLARAQRPHD